MFNEYCKQGLQSKKSGESSPKETIMIEGSIQIEEPCKTSKNVLSIQNMFWSYFTIKNA